MKSLCGELGGNKTLQHRDAALPLQALEFLRIEDLPGVAVRQLRRAGLS